MDIWTVLFDVVVLLGAGAILGGLFERWRQSAILGYLLAGALLGPNVLHVIQSGDEVLAISELGVALLLFVIGLEFSWARLRSMGRSALGTGVLQISLTTLVGMGLASALGLDAKAAIALGAIAALSSTACVLRTLAARAEIESAHGDRALGILLVQDMAVVPLVLGVGLLAAGGTAGDVLAGLVRTLGTSLGLVAVLFVTFHVLVPKLLATGSVRGNRELPLLIAVGSGLGAGVVTHAAGVSPALGAFVAGLLLAESPFALQVRTEVSSLKTLFLTLFFTAMGMLTDPFWIASHFPLVATAVLAILVGKAGIVWLVLRLLGTRGPVAIATGLCLAQTGEFSFVLAELARDSILDEETFLLVVSATVLTMSLTPYLVTHARRLGMRLSRDRDPRGPGLEQEDGGPVSLVIGFGPAGRAAAERIAELGCRVVVVEQNPLAAVEAARLEYRAITGDARYGEVLEHAGLGQADFVVVTVPVAETAIHIVRLVRQRVPKAVVVVRGRFHRSLPELSAAGAHIVVDEEHEVGRLIAEAFERERERALIEGAAEA